ncbi:hypothetical protein TIFTF001_005831 [Ficus carica]|uniref:Uncharacterized protein n=1 Tax=Ficus carica TaxID=3494 RepID=A0AA87ZPS4_FICCA|nr:hypothetical protein TIFTF001_005831 [Ficus carica]
MTASEGLVAGFWGGCWRGKGSGFDLGEGGRTDMFGWGGGLVVGVVEGGSRFGRGKGSSSVSEGRMRGSGVWVGGGLGRRGGGGGGWVLPGKRARGPGAGV